MNFIKVIRYGSFMGMLALLSACDWCNCVKNSSGDDDRPAKKETATKAKPDADKDDSEKSDIKKAVSAETKPEAHPMVPNHEMVHPVMPHPVEPHPFEQAHPAAPHPIEPIHPAVPHPVTPHPVTPHPVMPHPIVPHPVVPKA